MERVSVAVPSRTYDVTIGEGLLARAADHLPAGRQDVLGVPVLG